MTRPAHADPTLWDHADSVAGYGPKINPIVHAVRRIRTDTGWWYEAQCDSTKTYSIGSLVRTHWAAQFALPCLHCWPDAREGRRATVAARAKATA